MKLQTFPENESLIVPATPVEAFGLGTNLVDIQYHMTKIMQDNDGVGLAAPQIGISKRIFIMKKRKEIFSWAGAISSFSFIINPEIKWYSPEQVEWEEGCLSIPGVYGTVSRSRDIGVVYRNRSGVTINRTISGVDARVFQHEFDHLNGILFPQRIHMAKHGEWINLKSYSRAELSRLDFINELR